MGLKKLPNGEFESWYPLLNDLIYINCTSQLPFWKKWTKLTLFNFRQSFFI